MPQNDADHVPSTAEGCLIRSCIFDLLPTFSIGLEQTRRQAAQIQSLSPSERWVGETWHWSSPLAEEIPVLLHSLTQD